MNDIWRDQWIRNDRIRRDLNVNLNEIPTKMVWSCPAYERYLDSVKCNLNMRFYELNTDTYGSQTRSLKGLIVFKPEVVAVASWLERLSSE